MLSNTLVSIILLCVLAPFAGAKRLHARFPPASRTSSAIQARQITRDRLMDRAEKLTMSSLFGRADCSLPEPSTMACTCGPEYTLCGSFCRDLLGDVNNCGFCNLPCPPGAATPGCCSGSCVDLEGNQNCGTCGTACDTEGNEFCCDGGCRDIIRNPEHCGDCGISCDTDVGETCCDAGCVSALFFQDNFYHCGACENACSPGESCCGETCTDFQTDLNNCGACGAICAATCCGGFCTSIEFDEDNCGSCGHQCPFDSYCSGGQCVPE